MYSLSLRFVPILLILLTLTLDTRAQPADTAAVASASPSSASRRADGHSPEKALRRALIFPGWGQVYNRQYWKLPVVYGGIGGVTALAVGYGRQHRLYTRAYQYKAWEEAVERGQQEENKFPQYQDEYQKVVDIQCNGCEVNSAAIKPLRDKFRRNRDLSLFGIGLVYGLSILDAFVNAHLLDFDVSEDLTLQMYPHPDGVTASVCISL